MMIENMAGNPNFHKGRRSNCTDLFVTFILFFFVGKSGALHGLCHDATPFRFGSDDLKDNDAIDHFGKQLEAAGYNYYGTEVLYSG